MKRFADLYDEIDRTTSTNAKVAALVRYLREASPADAAWALFFLTGRRLLRLLPSRLLHEWTLELTAMPEWLVRESYSVVGDFAEAIALLLEGRTQPADPDALRQTRAAPLDATRLPFDDPAPPPFDAAVDGVSLADWIERRILPLRTLDDGERRVRVIAWWTRLPTRELFLLNKLLTGEFRVGVSHTLVVRALAERAGLPSAVVQHRLMGNWEPSAEAFAALLAPETSADEPSRPYPFCLASPLELTALRSAEASASASPADPEGSALRTEAGVVPDGRRADPVGSATSRIANLLGDRDDWLVEWKWDGIRAQLIRRAGQVFLWSRGEEVITDRFPEIVAAAQRLPDGTVLDGEILAFEDGVPRPFADLQRRIGRQRRVREVAEDVPAVFVAYDLLEEHGVDIRETPISERRARLIALWARAPTAGIRLSEALGDSSWEGVALRRAESRAHGVEGLMLKRWTSPYRPGRKRGDWWKWKIEPHSIDVVLIYAQPGSGRRASLFTDYTFGVWHEGELVPVAKAYSGLTDDEIDELDRWIRRHTIERFGPVSAVEPVHVFELGFERIAASTRHRSGVAVRFPRMLRWRRDKPAAEADTLETLRGFLNT